MSSKLKELIVCTIIVTFLFGLIIGNLSYNKRVGNYGRIIVAGCEVYWDLNKTQVVDSIFWGENLGYNHTVIKTVYVNSLSNDDANLTVVAANWNPIDAAVLVFTIQPNFTVIHPDEMLLVQLTLHVSPYIPITTFTDFTFDIFFSATTKSEV